MYELYLIYRIDATYFTLKFVLSTLFAVPRDFIRAVMKNYVDEK